jgi:hypothetical protein
MNLLKLKISTGVYNGVEKMATLIGYLNVGLYVISDDSTKYNQVLVSLYENANRWQHGKNQYHRNQRAEECRCSHTRPHRTIADNHRQYSAFFDIYTLRFFVRNIRLFMQNIRFFNLDKKTDLKKMKNTGQIRRKKRRVSKKTVLLKLKKLVRDEHKTYDNQRRQPANERTCRQVRSFDYHFVALLATERLRR